MLSRLNGAALLPAQTKSQSREWAVFGHEAIKSLFKKLFTTAHRALLLLGVSAIATLGMMYFNPSLADRLKALSPFTVVAKPEPTVVIVPTLGNLLDTAQKPLAIQALAVPGQLMTAEDLRYMGTPEQKQMVTNWLSKRYHVATDATDMLVNASYSAAREAKLDPLLILAVMCIESGLNPFAESPVGAQGLMQVMWKVHHARFDGLGGEKAALNPVANIKVGALILHDFVVRGGSVEAGLKSYVGAAAFDNDGGYGSKVLAEYHRLQEVSMGKNVPTTFTPVVTTTALKRANDGAAEGKSQAEPDSAAVDSRPAAQKAMQFAAL